MRRALAIYRQYIRISFSAAMAYRANFILTVVISLAGQLLAPLLVALIYTSGAAFPGWSFEEAWLMQSVYLLCTGVCSVLFSNMTWITMEHIREGTYDLLMLKPGSTVFITVAGAFDLENVGLLLGGAGMFAFSLSRLPQPSLLDWLSFAALFLMGLFINLGCILIMAASAFKWVGNSRIYEIFDAVTLFGRYPLSIFSGVLRGIISAVIPVAMMGFFPAAALLGRRDAMMLFAPLPCILFLVLGWALFKRMTYLYQSAGG